MKLYLARHGETPLNLQHKFYGTLDVGLTTKGLAQAQQLAKRIKLTGTTTFCCSGQLRAQQTLMPLVTKYHQPFQQQAAFNEKGFGAWEGLDADEIQAGYPKAWQAWLAAPLSYTPPQAESFVQFQQRVLAGWQQLLTTTTTTNLVLIAHLGTLRVLDQYLFASDAVFWDIRFNAGQYTVIDWQNEQATLLARNV
ncbi:histidine phosphatase family protein [Loigolactobacillus jiayinensis]|uniref:phosphoglycerate mutase (2,3-diphosphoglycerate-dependent) n=1 Tax=Loigolactobacillus jiayinensis TaxID=2486016 RepID=A0ABW1RBU6_9LACO|nr:histidine phosphatase family protein [Loigolactobacillus jiayinensis]